MIRNDTPSIAICDACGDEGETIETRNHKSGALTAAFLPEHWQTFRVDRELLHICGACVPANGDLFGDRRDAFDARLDHLGPAMLAPIAASLGLPDSIAARWCAAWKEQQRKVA